MLYLTLDNLLYGKLGEISRGEPSAFSTTYKPSSSYLSFNKDGIKVETREEGRFHHRNILYEIGWVELEQHFKNKEDIQDKGLSIPYEILEVILELKKKDPNYRVTF